VQDQTAFRPVLPGTPLSAWQMATAEETHFPGVARPMPDRVDYRFVNGWVDTGDLPCREALKARVMAQDPCPPRPDAVFSQIVLAGDDANIDFSRFCHRPTLIRRVFRCWLRAEATVAARFALRTCGGVRIWVEDDLACTFQPFTRNKIAVQDVTLEIGSKAKMITLELEDLHERDTTCFFALHLLSGEGLSAAYQDGAEGSEQIDQVAQAFLHLRTDKVFYQGGTVRLLCDMPPDAPVTVHLSNSGSIMRGGITGIGNDLPQVSGQIGKGLPPISLFKAALAPQGCLYLNLSAEVAGATLRRTLGTTVLARKTLLDQPDLAARKSTALAAICAERIADPSVALALIAAGEQPEDVATMVDHAIHEIDQRFDCADFTLLPMLRILRDYRNRLGATQAARLEHSLLGFRYWLDEPGDDVMWFWSENHVLCFHVGQLVTGQMFPERVFVNSGKTGAILAVEATARLHRWFDAIEAEGLGEWNSAAYYPIDLLALFTLHDMTTGDLRARAIALMDQIFAMTALHSCGGVSAGSQGRAYEKELLAGPATELASVAAIAFGGPLVPGFDRVSVLFCLSDYAPPLGLAAFVHPQGGAMEAAYTQGLDHLGKLRLWKGAHVLLSCVEDHKTGQRGHQQHVVDAQCAGHPMARLWVNHPGELKVWGERRPSLLAGNGVLPRVAQAGNVALLIYDLPDDPTVLPFTQCFAATEAFEAIEAVEGWRVFHSDAARIAVWCSAPLQTVTDGLYAGSLHRAHALRTAWVIMVDEGPLQDFTTRLSTLPLPRFDPVALSLSLSLPQTGALHLDFAQSLSIDGRTTPFAPLTSTPHVRRSGKGRLRPWTDDLATREDSL
jgi:hypothetical protein